MNKIFVALVSAVFLNAPAARGQAGPVEGGHELQVWTGGGHGISGSQSGDGIWNAGFRYGLILTAPHGPGFLRGRLEYALDAVPVFLVVQKTNTAYGVGVNPFAFKWAFATQYLLWALGIVQTLRYRRRVERLLAERDPAALAALRRGVHLPPPT